MAEQSLIEWTDATVNFWWGCTKVGPGCDNCYAETWAKRWKDDIWGVGAPRRKIKSALKLLYRLENDYAQWNADAAAGLHPNFHRRVFLQSMSDLFDREVPAEWFDEAWAAISDCTHLDIQIVTKRISYVEKRLAGRPWPSHAGLIITVVNQDEADRDIPRLLDLKARLGIPWVGLSMEPLLGPVTLEEVWHGESALSAECWGECAWCEKGFPPLYNCQRGLQDGGHWSQHPTGRSGIDWVIVGGESGRNARPMQYEWATALRDQCADAGAPFFFKQWGEWAPRRTPDGLTMQRVGKASAGRLLDGRRHNAFPHSIPSPATTADI